MNKIKAKLTALLMAVCCCLGCLGIGVAVAKPTADNVVANAATTEELTTEFTNNGQFTFSQYKDGMTYEVVDSTTEGVPEGATGAVLKITGTGEDSSSNGGAFVTFDFTAAGLFRTGQSIVVRVYSPGNADFRVSKTAGSYEWKTTQSGLAAGWHEITLDAVTNTTEDHQIITTMSCGLRRATECYIDSVTLVDNDLKKDFTNNGQFEVKQYSTNRTLYVDGVAEGLPEGYEGTVLKVWNGGTQYVILDFSAGEILAKDVLSISAKCYLPNAYTNSDGTATYTNSNYEFRANNSENSSGGAGAYDMSTWFDATIPLSKISTDENGYLTTVTVGLRNKGNQSAYFYIDSITLDMVDYNVIQVGQVELYGSGTSETRVDRLYLKPTDQTVTWYDTNGNFTWESGTGLQQIRGGEVVASSHLALANRNSNVGSASNVKHFYLDIGSLSLELEAGDVIRYGGTFYNKTAGMKYVIEDSEILWDGTNWGKNTEYTTHEISELKPVHPSTTSGSNKAIYLKMKSGDALPLQTWEYHWYLESGDGLKVNGEAVTVNAMQSAPEGIYITFNELQAGDEISFGGTFRCPALKLKYTIAESKAVWNGTIWESYIEYTTYNVGDVKFQQVGGTGNRYVYLTPVSTAGLDTDTWNSGWDAKFSWKDGTGVTLNGEEVANVAVKFPGSFFIDLATAPAEGDILRVGGTYYNTSVAKEYNINEAAFIYNGTGWETYVEYTTHELGTLIPNRNSNGENASATAATGLYLKREDGGALPYASWDAKFTWESGDGWKKNGETITLGNIVCANEGLYVALSSAGIQAGDVLTVSGTFTYATDNAKIVIEESSFMWTGYVWAKYGETTAYEIGQVAIEANSTATAVNLKKASGAAFEATDGTWTEKLYFIPGTGAGVTLNGEALKVTDMKVPNNIYLGLEGKTAVADDVLVIGGAFYNANLAVKYIIEESTFVYNGTAWEAYVEETPVEYTTYTVTQIGVAGTQAAEALYLYSPNGEIPKELGDWDNVYTFVADSGEGVLLNDTALTGIKMPGDLYVPLGRMPEEGDILTVDGALRNETTAIELVFENCQLQFNGTAWVEYVPAVEYTVYELGELSFQGLNGSNVKFPEFASAAGVEIPSDTNWLAYTCESGVGATINGVNVAAVKFPSVVFIELSAAPSEGDELVIGGTFYNEELARKFVITDTTFIWDGSAWTKEGAAVEYTVYELGELVPHANSVTNNNPRATQLYMKRADGSALPYAPSTWDHKFVLDSGNGWTKNGEAITLGELVSTNAGLYVNLATANVQVGDVLTVSGTFVCELVTAKYVITESKFTWNGTAWEKYVEYTTYTINALTFSEWTANSNHIYFTITADEYANPNDGNGGWSAEFQWKNGVGVTVNEENVGSVVKFPGRMFIALNHTPVEGDVVAVGGTFYNANLALQYVVPESIFVWYNDTWMKYVEYTTYELSELECTQLGGENKQAYFTQISGEEIVNGDWVVYTCESGVGVKINDVAASAVVKMPAAFFIEFTNAPAEGDKLTFGGTFYNEIKELKYVVPESTFWWNGTTWTTEEPVVEYTVYELGALVPHANSVSQNNPRATQLYMKRADGSALPYAPSTWDHKFVLDSGNGWTKNGEAITLGELVSTNVGLYVNLATANVQVGDVLTVSGTFTYEAITAQYVIEESSFMWNGTSWVSYYTDLATYDVVSLYDIGMTSGVWTINGEISNEVSRFFAASTENTTNSVALRIGYNASQDATGALDIRLRGDNWTGFHFQFNDGKIKCVTSTMSFALSNNTQYTIEIGAVDTADGENVWVYIKIDDVLRGSTLIARDAEGGNSGYTTNHVSLYASAGVYATITEAGNVTVTYVSSGGTHTVRAKREQVYTLATGKSTKMFIGWAYDGVLYQPGDEFGKLTGNITFTAVELDFTMEDGAAIRLAGSADYSGIRFTSAINEAELNALLGQYGITNIAYGTLIIPYDYLAVGQKPNLDNFTPNEDILKIDSTKSETKDGYVIIRGAMQKIYEENYGRLFAGRAYMEITFEGGETIVLYTPFDYEDNVRSIRMVAKAFKADASAPENENDLRYSTITDEQRAIVDAYIGTAEIELMNYASYNANAMNVMIWNYPALDPSNNYDNDTNTAVVETMKEAGIKVIGLTGANILSMSTTEKIEQTRQIINYLWSQGIYTFAFQNNGGNRFNIDFSQLGYPDFSDCEGFMGFLAWDEPTVESIDSIATQVAAFEAAYAGTGVTFMGNLLPSYASIFHTDGELDKAAFKAYLQKYCDTVLTQVSGEKWLSIDTYPIMADQTLLNYFLYDIGTLKTVALENDAHAHVILQSYGYVEDGNADKERMPSEAELRMQAYTAMAFGVDSMSWYVYSPNGHGESDTAVDVNGAIADQENYDALKNINAELAAIGNVYNAFDWKGIILGAGKDNGYKIGSWVLKEDNDYDAFARVMGQLGEYELSASDTKHLASVSTNKTDWNYLMGVMEDAHGNEGYVLCNYNSHEENRAQTITLTFDSNITEVVIYRGGVAETISVTNKTLAVSLATGEGVIILPSKLG